LERLLLTDEQSLVPRSRPVFADKSKHDDLSAIPPSAALCSERPILTTKSAMISPNAIPYGPLLAQSGRSKANIGVIYKE
jgi:hypothetical protein